jgi:hypothetical protein
MKRKLRSTLRVFVAMTALSFILAGTVVATNTVALAGNNGQQIEVYNANTNYNYVDVCGYNQNDQWVCTLPKLGWLYNPRGSIREIVGWWWHNYNGQWPKIYAVVSPSSKTDYEWACSVPTTLQGTNWVKCTI